MRASGGDGAAAANANGNCSGNPTADATTGPPSHRDGDSCAGRYLVTCSCKVCGRGGKKRSASLNVTSQPRWSRIFGVSDLPCPLRGDSLVVWNVNISDSVRKRHQLADGERGERGEEDKQEAYQRAERAAAGSRPTKGGSASAVCWMAGPSPAEEGEGCSSVICPSFCVCLLKEEV